MTTRRAALALALALAVPAARAGDVSARATLHVRATSVEARPGTSVRFDRASLGYDLGGYLAPSDDERYGSTYASFSLDGGGLGGDLRWRLALDTGELRRRSSPLVADVCWAETPTGLQVVGAGCGLYELPRGTAPRRVIAPIEETREGPAELVSNGRPFADEVEETLLVREVYAALSFGRASFATVRAGRKRVSVGDGFVYDDYAMGAELALDLGAIGPPLALGLSVVQPTRDTPGSVDELSPLVAVRADFLPSLFEHAGLFAAAYRDRSGGVAELFRGAVVERAVGHLAQATVGTEPYRDAARNLLLVLAAPLESDATLGWLGTSGSLVPFRGQRLRWTAALLGGRVDRVTAAGGALVWAEDVSLRGELFSLRWDASLGEVLGLGLSFLHLSGGTFTRGAGGEYGGFLGIAPFVTATNLFFGGGLSESFAARQSTAPGVNGRGVTAPGLSVTFDPTDALGVELTGAYLRAPVEGPLGGRVYGAELDAVVRWSPRDWLVLGAELDVLWPGDFFAGAETVYKTVLALDLVTP